MTDETTNAEPSGASGGSLANYSVIPNSCLRGSTVEQRFCEPTVAGSTPAAGLYVQWIPVSERLPEKGERVLFFVNRRSTSYAAVYAGQYLPVFDVWEYCPASEKGWAAAFVTHWMPLPAPPTDTK